MKRYLLLIIVACFTSGLTLGQNKEKQQETKSADTGVSTLAVPPPGGGEEYPPDAPPSPSITSYNCGSTTLSRNGTVPSDELWYWQTSASGTSTQYAGPSYSVTTTGTYYLRSRGRYTQLWGGSSPVSVGTVKAIPGVPTAPTATNECGRTILTRGTPPAGVTWYWQGTTSTGTSKNYPGQTYTVYAGGTYYIRAYHNSSGCWSSARSVTASPYPATPAPAPPVVSANTCGDKTLTANGEPPHITPENPYLIYWYWQGTNPNGTSTSQPGSSAYTATTTGTYYIRAKNVTLDCWSSSASVSVTVNAYPASPATPSATTNHCGDKTLTRGTPPNGITWYWQGTTASGTSTLNNAPTYTAGSTGTYYLRARNNATGCWSTARALPVTVNAIPGEPTATVSPNECGIKTLTRDTPPASTTWYWQTTASGTSTTNSEASYPVTTSGTYYLRGKTEAGCWSTALALPVTVKDIPLEPEIPGVATNQCGDKILTRGTPPEGTTWYWQGGNPAGTSTSDTSATYTATSTGTYYLRAQTSEGCWSTAAGQAVTAELSTPVIVMSTTEIPPGGTVALSVFGCDYDTYSWQRNGVEVATTPTYAAGTAGSYTVTVTKYTEESIKTSESITLTDDVVLTNPNYVINHAVHVPGALTASDVQNLGTGEHSRSTQYIGGLGTTLQTIAGKASPNGKDLVQPHAYDIYGREHTQYMSYASTGDDSQYRPHALDNSGYTGSEQYNFYQQASDIAHDQAPYATMEVESSPLQRTLSTTGAGENWHTGQKNVRHQYQLNTDADAVRQWEVNSSGLPVSNSTYPAGTLTKRGVTDEAGNQAWIFADKLGQTILKKVQVDATTWADTYYIYDEMGRKRFVLPPALVAQMNTAQDFTPGQTQLDHWAFQYHYGVYNRLTGSKTPGAGWTYSIYDERGRIVMTQHANQRDPDFVQSPGTEWTFVKYDRYDRAILTGIYTDTNSLSASAMQTVADNFYNQGGKWFEEKGTAVHGYTNQSFPPVSNEDAYLTVNYYDDYDFKNHTGWQSSNYEFNNPDELTTLQTDGTDDYIALNQYYDEAGQLSELTAEAWINTTFNEPGSANWSILDFDRNEYFLFTVNSDGRVQFSTRAAVTHDMYSTRSDLNDGQWHHIAVVYDGKDKHIYIDGEPDKTTVNPHNAAGLGSGVTRYGFIGDGSEATTYNGNRNRNYFQGKIGEVRLWHTTRSASDIYAYRDVRLTGNEPGLEGMWTMEAREGTTLTDQTGNGNDGTLQNMDDSAWGSELSANGQPLTAFERTHGLPTGNMTKTTAGQWLKTAVYYDNRYRPIQSVSDNHLGGQDVTTNYYNFAGETLRAENYHHDGTYSMQTTVRYAYDHVGRLTAIYHQVNNNQEVAISKMTYNELGQLVEKDLHEKAGSYLQSVDLQYNIRGWLTAINDPGLASDPADHNEDLFGMQLQYETAPNARYDGNIGAIAWNKAGSGNSGRYDYTYDKMSRLTAADYSGELAGGYDASASYDVNGNILRANRFANHGTREKIDELVYNYGQGIAAYSNQLLKVKDDSGSAYKEEGFKDVSGDDYLYDANGNITRDPNKGITGISYNHMNLPLEITFENGTTISYIYAATGAKLSRKEYNNDTLKTTTDYIGNLVYEDNTLQFIAHPEGRVVKKADGQVEYQYAYTDHLGNIRMLYTSSPDETTFTANMESTPNQADDALFEGTNSTADALATSGTSVTRLSAGQISGPALTLPVYPGDTIAMQVQGFYRGGSGTSTADLSTLIAAVAGSFGGVNGGTTSEQAVYNAFDQAINPALGGFGLQQAATGEVAAYLNYIMFDKNMQMVQHGHWPMDDDALANPTLMKLDPAPVAQKEGFIYVYLTNESDSEVYYDDFEVTVKESMIVQSNDYYPFGLQHNTSWTRPTDLKNNFLYNAGSELNEHTKNYETTFRNYDPALGRFMGVDIMASAFSSQTPYNYALNNPIMHNDPTGLYPPGTIESLNESIGEARWAMHSGGGAYGGHVSDYYGSNQLWSNHTSTSSMIRSAWNRTSANGWSVTTYNNGAETGFTSGTVNDLTGGGGNSVRAYNQYAGEANKGGRYNGAYVYGFEALTYVANQGGTLEVVGSVENDFKPYRGKCPPNTDCDPNRPNKGTKAGIAISGASGVGKKLELGVAWDRKGKWTFYFSLGVQVGYDGSVGVVFGDFIQNRPETPFTLDKIAGDGHGWNVGVGILDFSHGGDQITNMPFDYGKNYIEGSSGYSAGVSGATYSWMRTWTFGGNL